MTDSCVKQRLKLVSLSISDGRPRKGPVPTMPLRDSAIWHPDIPDPHHSVIGIRALGDGKDAPVSTAIFGGRDGEALGSVSSVAFRFDTEDGEGGSLLGLKVSFANGLESVGIGVDTGRCVNSGGNAEGAVLPGPNEADEEDEDDEEYSEGQGAGVEEELTFSIDGESGERIIGVDTIYRSKYVNRAIRVTISHNPSSFLQVPAHLLQ